MKLFKIMMLWLVGAFAAFSASGQANASINVLTQNSGQVGLGGTVFIQVDVGNTGPTSNIGVNKVRAQISIPIAIAHALPNAQQTGLPPGWTIVTNTGGAIQVCNGSDVIPVNAVRTVLIAVQGDALGGPSTVTGVLSFGPGTGVCTGPGSLAGDITADNTSSSTIQVIPAPACSLAVSASAGTISCNGGTTTLTATPTGASGAVEYSITGGAPFQASNTFTVSAGTYTVTAREAANTTCTATAGSVTVTQPTALSGSASSTAVTSPGGSDGTATASASGGTPPYTYSWAPGGQTTVTATGLAAGSYTVTITDANGCTTSASTTVTAPVCNISASAVAGSAIICNGGTTTLTVTVTGGTAPVQYSLNGGAFQSGNTFTVGAGTYTVSVKDASNCTATTNSVTITQPTAVVASANAPAIALPGGTTTITVGATGGTPPYTGTGTFDRGAGTYNFTVTDANGCTGIATITLTDPVAGNANASINILTLNSGQVNQGSVVDVQVSVGNTGPSFIGNNKVRAQISIPIAIATALPTAQQTGLPPGWTILTNTGGTITICNGTDFIPAGVQRQILIKVQGVTAGGPSTITGVLSFGPGTGVCTGPGSLPGDITADNTSTSTIQVISTCNITASASAGTIACNGGTTTLTVTPTGGTAPLQYSLNGGAFQAGNTFSVNAAGSPYSVTVKDANNCTATTNSVTVTQPTQLTATASSTPVTTNGGTDGTATASVSGGTPPYTYSWSPGSQTTQTATGLTAGTYTVTVTDANSCTTTATTTVGSPTCNISASAVAGAAITCNSGTTTLTVSVTGGTAPIQYSLNGGAFQSGNSFTVGAGTYTVSVKDASNCTATTNSVTITQPTAVVVSANAPPIALPGGTTTITVGATGGTPPYTGTGTFVRGAGTYNFTVTDANGCTGLATITLSDPVAGNANASINILTLNSGQVNQGSVVDVQVSVGNTGPSFIGNNKVRAQISIPIAIATALPTAQQTGLPPGWTILTNTGGTITICNGTDFIPAGVQRQILIKVQGVTAGGPSTITGVLSFGPGTGVCTGPGSLPGDITADNTSTSTIQVISTCNITASAAAGTIACNGGTTTLTVTPTGGTAPLQYSLNGGAFQAGNTFTVNAAGSPYTVTVKDANNCTATTNSVTVTEPTAINASASAGTIACNGGSTTLTVTATGGTGAYQYSLNGGAFQAGNTFSVNAAGSPYSVTVKDANNCTATSNSVTVTQPTQLTATASSTPVTTIGGTDGTATASASGGTPPYTYSWAPGGQTTVTATGLTAGSYTVTVTDANSCTTTATTTVGSPTCNISASAVAGAAITCNGGTTTLTVSVTGGTAPVQYSLNGGAFQSGNSFTVGAGTYTVSVKDASNCTATTNSVTITQPTAVVVSANAPPIALPGGTTTITVGATGGTPPYTGTGTFVRGAGTYNFTVTDANGCTGLATITLSDPVAGNANASINILTLNSGQVNQGSVVDVQVSVGNTGPSFIGNNKVRAQISIPIAIATALPTAQQTGLPPGWTILTNTGGTITICNGTDFIPAGVQRQILIKVQGVTAGGPSTITGVLSFGPGTGVCTGPGSLPGDITADNTSTSTIQVISTCNITASASAGTIACNGGTTTLTVTPTGGTAPLQYSLNGGAFQAGNTFSVNAAGSPYSVTVKDANNCTATTNSVTVTQPTQLTATASSTPVTTNGGTDGTATASVSGGTPPYTYSWSPGSQTTQTATGLTAGTYTVTVLDANECSTTATTTVGSPACNISASATAGTIACPGGTTTLTVTVTGGAAPVQYSLNGAAFQAGNTFTVTAGTYTVSVKDASNCTATTNTVTVAAAVDNTNPTITAPANVIACTNTGCTATGVMLGTPVTADNCTVASVTNNAPGAFPVGSTTVTWTVTDGSGNTATATQTVTVTDNTPPVIALNQSGLSLPGVTGPSSSASPYVLPLIPGVKFTSILSSGDNIGGYQMAGVPDGLGAFDNCDGTFTLLMNHEILNTLGSIRAHGGKGSFVSRWIINKSNFQVMSGSDLMQQVYFWNSATQTNDASPTAGFAFHRFCSGDLPSVSAYYNASTGLGTQARIYMHGEEGATGFQMGTVASGPDAGKAYVLGKFNLATNGSGINAVGNWENALANPFAQNKTVVIANSDGGTGIMTNAVVVYVGTKTNTGSEVDKAGLTNGTLSFINVTGNPVEIVNNTTRATNITSGTAFTLSATTATVFSRPEDGVWNPLNPSQYFFVTTDQLDQVGDGMGAQVGRSRLWRLNFTDITNPQLGGTIDLLINGSEGNNMFDNMTADKCGHLILLEDVGNAAHNGKVWQYTIATNQLVKIAKHDPARFGDIGVPATTPFNQDEETSGVIDVSEILGAGMNLVVDQAHYTLPNPMVEGGQLMAFFNPASMCATGTAQDTVKVCSGTGVNLGTPATADNCSVASVTNNAPGVFPAGTTNVIWTVTDGNGNTATATQVVIVSNLAVTAASTPVTTNGGTDGTATATATGGTAPYTYVWTPGGQTTATATGLAAGSYSVTITDARGCTATATTTVGSPACNILAVASAGTITCFGETTTLTVTASGATGAVQYSLNGGAFQAGNTFTVGAGVYTVTVKDASNCTSTSNTVTVTQPSAINASASAGTIACNGGNTTLTVTAAGGTGAFQYSLNGGASQAGNTFSVGTGTYTVAVSDANGCTTTTNSVTVTEPAAIVASASAGTIACFGGTTTLTVTASGGTGAFQYSLNGGAFQAGNTFTVNAAGSPYTITVKDASSCTATTNTVSVTQPVQLIASASSTPVSSIGGTDGTATASASGGTPPYTYVWTPGGQTTVTATGLSAGSYSVLVTDANGCSTTATATVGSPACSILASASAGTIACFGGTTTLTVSVTGATGAVQYSLNGGAFQAGSAFVVGAGTYTVSVKDANNCTATTATVHVFQPTAITASASAGTIACNGGTTTLTVTAAGGTGAFQYSLNGGASQAGNTFTVGAGTYTVSVSDANSCTTTTNTVTVTEPAAIAASASAGTIACNGGTTTLTVTATGGTGAFQYSLNGGAFQAGNTFTVGAGTYTVSVKDTRSCTAITNSVIVIQPAAIVASASTGTIACNGGTTTLTVTATGGTGAFQYSLNGGAFQAGNTFTVAAGSYTVSVKDANNCTATTAAVSVSQPTPLIVTTSATSATSGSNGTATATATGGTAPYIYLWSPGGQTTATATGLAAGTYTVVVTDAGGCSVIKTAVVASDDCTLIVSAGPDKEICPGSSVMLTASASGGTPTGAPAATPFTELAGSSSDFRLFSGNIDHVTIGQTFSLSETNSNCGQLTQSTATKALVLPAGAVVKRAYLYWSGSGSLDYSVKLNGTTVTADAADRETVSDQPGFTFFGAKKDVTSLVTGAGNYTLTDLTWNNGSPYCGVSSAYGAWAMTVIYELASLPSARIHVNSEVFRSTFRTPNGTTVSSTISNISVPAGCTANAKLTFVAFEGDAYKGENLKINNVLDADPNNFRGQSGFNLDIFTKNAPSVVPGTASLTYSIQSYLVNNAIERLFDYVKVLKYNYCPPPSCSGYKYEWKRNGVVVGTSQSITASVPGTYTVKVSDCGTCVKTDEVVVSASTLAASSTVGTPIACNGGTTTVTVSATGGTAPYTGTGVFTKAAGTCNFTVTDAKGCSVVTSVTIAQPAALVAAAIAPAIPCGGTTTTVVVSATGGTAPYTGTGTFTKGPGTWTFTVTDAKGCTKSATVTIANAIACGPVDPNKCYKIVNRNSSKAADVVGSSTTYGALVEQRTFSGTTNQIWKFSPVETGFYSVINWNSGKVMDVKDVSTANNANVQQWAYSGGNNQKWSITPSGSYFVIKAKHSGKALAVKDASNANGANVVQFGNGSDTYQQWTISEVGCPAVITRTADLIAKEGGDPDASELSLAVQPNPSINYFNLTIKSSDNTTPVDVRVVDVNGKVVSAHQKATANSTLRISAETWAGGIYFAEVTQGGQRKVVKLIKVN